MAYSIEVKEEIIERMDKEKDDSNSERHYAGKTEEYEYEKGVSLFRQRKYNDAKKHFISLIEYKGEFYSRSIFFLGKIYVIERRYKEARKEFKRYIEIDKDRNPHAHLELGKLNVTEGRYKEAREEFKRYIEINKDRSSHAHLELGRLNVIEGRYAEAREEFNRCVQIDKDRSPYGHLELGKLNVKEGRYKEAREEFKRYIEIDKDGSPHGHFELGRLNVIEGRYEEAREEFNRCVQIDKDRSSYGHFELGKLNVTEGRYKEAREEFKRYIEIDKDRNPHAHLELGKLNVIEGRYEEAREEFNRYIEIDKDRNPHAHLELGRLNVIEGRYEEAREEFKRYIEIDKDRSPHAHLELGRLNVKAKRYKEAREEFKRYIEIDKDRSPHGHFELGRLNVIEGRYAEAREEFNRCIEIDKHDQFAECELKLLQEMDIDGESDKNIQTREKEEIDSIFKNIINESDKNDLSKIRAQLYYNTIDFSSINEIESLLEGYDKKIYYLVMIAIYEKMGSKSNALKLIKEMEAENITIKEIETIKQRLKSKKTQIFDLDKWDRIIGWDVSMTEDYEIERRKSEKEETNDTNDFEKTVDDKIKDVNTNTEKTDSKMNKENKKSEDKYITSVIETHKKSKTKKQSDKKEKNDLKEKRTILMDLDATLKEIINEINCKYYLKMQPTSKESMLPKEYYEALEGIKSVRGEEKLRRMSVMQDCLKEGYTNSQTRKEYTRKYDKLQVILGCDSTNKRAKMELMLILINEGYEETVKESFNKQDYEFIHNIIMQYNERKIELQDARNSIDEYCL